MSGSIDQWEARMDREFERVMKMTIEEIAAEEGKTVEQVLEEARQMKERVLASLRARGAKV